MKIEKIGCYYHTSWTDKQSWRNVTYDKPLLGRYSCYDKQVLRRQIDWALDHGISYFVVNWYWNSETEPVEDEMVASLLEVAEGTTFKIAINWCTEQYSNWLKIKHNWRYGSICMETISAEEISGALLHATRKFFHHQNYFRMHDKQVFYLYWANFILKHFGKNEFTKIIAELRQSLIKEGIDLYLVAVDQSATGKMIADLSEVGADAVTFYGIPSTLAPWVKKGNKLVNEATYEELINEYIELWRIYNDACDSARIRFIPQVIAGYDNYPRHLENHAFLIRRLGATPQLFRTLCAKMKEHNHTTSEVMINAWNEWEESSAIEPGEGNGFEFLNAIKDEFTTIADEKDLPNHLL